MNALIGRKLGMARLFNEEGTHVPVTVIEAGPCPIVQVTSGAAGTAVQLGFGAKKPKRASKALLGHVKRAGLEVVPRVLQSFPVAAAPEGAAAPEPKPGEAVSVAIFQTGDIVKVSGGTKRRRLEGVETTALGHAGHVHDVRSEEHTPDLQSPGHLVCLLR